MDLFSEDVGVPFEAVRSFHPQVGGSPTNIAVGSSRLGLKVALVSAVGRDRVGDFVLDRLSREGVEVSHSPIKPRARTSLALLAIEPPDRFPLVFYRENPADVMVTIGDIGEVPFASARALLLSGTALSSSPCREALMWAAEVARGGRARVFMDLDLRPDQWRHPRAYGLAVRALWPRLDVVIGTEEEAWAALGEGGEEELETAIARALAPRSGPGVFILKRGVRGATIFTRDAVPQDVPGFPVTVVNTVGAGDAFASGLLLGFVRGRSWAASVRLANACGALVVGRQGCSEAMPYLQEVEAFLERYPQGGAPDGD